MGGKKKSLANRLARMTDEERARYLQHKADIEEEAKRRKEQLIAKFMKNKIKKEDGFSRLNLAKINQNWHQIMRAGKCRQMREDVEHMKKYIDGVLDYKNRTINILLEELEMAEKQYGHNFQAHVVKIQTIIENHEVYMAKLESQHQDIIEELLKAAVHEQQTLLDTSKEQQDHLKTIIFEQKATANIKSKNIKEIYQKKKEELTSTFHLGMNSLIKHREGRCGAIWRQIAGVVTSHVNHTDMKRLHLAELKRLDAESAAEITQNQERINSQEEEIKLLNTQYENTQIKQNETIEKLTKKFESESGKFSQIRKQFRKEVQNGDKTLICLTTASNKSIDFLEKIHSKGQQIVNLMLICRKFETERERIAKWMPLETVTENPDDEEAQKNFKREDSCKSKASIDETEENIKKIVISAKSPETTRPSTAYSAESTVINNEFALLLNLEQFWLVYGKVNLECKELNREKKLLLEENKQLRGMIRAGLEAVVLDQSAPCSKVSTRVASKSRSTRSAPLRRVVI